MYLGTVIASDKEGRGLEHCGLRKVTPDAGKSIFLPCSSFCTYPNEREGFYGCR